MHLKSLRTRIALALALALAIPACGSEDPKTTKPPADDADDNDDNDGTEDNEDNEDTDDTDDEGNPEVDAGADDGTDPSDDDISEGDAAPLPYFVDANHVPSGHMGDGSIEGETNITAAPSDLNPDGECGGDRVPNAMGKCHTFTYTPSTSENMFGWAGVAWLPAEGNFDDESTQAIEAGATKLKFSARSDKAVTVEFFAGLGAENPVESWKVQLYQQLTKEWAEYTLDVSAENLTTLKGAFGWAIGADMNMTVAGPYTIYIDNIRYEK